MSLVLHSIQPLRYQTEFIRIKFMIISNHVIFGKIPQSFGVWNVEIFSPNKVCVYKKSINEKSSAFSELTTYDTVVLFKPTIKKDVQSSQSITVHITTRNGNSGSGETLGFYAISSSCQRTAPHGVGSWTSTKGRK